MSTQAARSLALRADLSAMAAVEHFIDGFCAAGGVGQDVGLRLLLVIEELLTNLARYGGTPPPEMTLALSLADAGIELVVEDDGAPFDPTLLAPPNLSPDAAARRVGGLGVHMVRHLMDDVAYQRLATRNRLILRKHLTAAA